MYAIAPSRTALVQRGSATSVRVLYRDQEVPGDVSAAQVAIWNEGRAAVKATSVLVPVAITMLPPVPILEATIRHRTRELIGVALDTQDAAHGRVTLPFRILEQGDGVPVQLVYAGSVENVIAVQGAVEDQKSIEHLAIVFRKSSSTARLGFLLVGAFSALIALVIGLGGVLVYGKELLDAGISWGLLSPLLSVVMFACLLAFFGLVAFTGFRGAVGVLGPPFQF